MPRNSWQFPLGVPIIRWAPDRQSEGALWRRVLVFAVLLCFVASRRERRDVPDGASQTPNREELVLRILKTLQKKTLLSLTQRWPAPSYLIRTPGAMAVGFGSRNMP